MTDRPGPQPPDPDERPLWRIEIAVLATEEEIHRITGNLITTICPSPDHDGDCATPWSLTTTTGASLSKRRQAALRESIASTNPQPPDGW